MKRQKRGSGRREKDSVSLPEDDACVCARVFMCSVVCVFVRMCMGVSVCLSQQKKSNVALTFPHMKHELVRFGHFHQAS